MIDPLHGLAFSLQANPGVYALLLGSGVSSAAKVLTGWQITLDLVRQLAELHGERPADVEAWFCQQYGVGLDYSVVLEHLAKTPAERQKLLRRYWKPTPEERNRGEKAPTAAHRAIARLAAKGYLKVVITTNFDRLVESAMRDAGVEPQVLSTVDQIEGAVPLVHEPCTVIKLHGDYQDTRLRNTPKELAKYPREIKDLLHYIFEKFGLIVCGWSAEWDEALRTAICRVKSRRYSVYWGAYGELSERAQKLITHREAQTIRIQSADSFFQSLEEHVDSIDSLSRSHPGSTAIVVETAKRYLPEEKQDIRLHDLVNKVVNEAIEGCADPVFNADSGEPNLAARIHRYDALCETLLGVAAASGYWNESRHHRLWTASLHRLMTARHDIGFRRLSRVQRYPASLLLYALGVGAVANRRLGLVGELLAVATGDRDEPSVAAFLSPFWLADRGEMRQLDGMSDEDCPLNKWMYNKLCKSFTSFVAPAESIYRNAFVELEVLLALSHRTEIGHDGVERLPPGLFIDDTNTEEILNSIDSSIYHEAGSRYVVSGIFGAELVECGLRLGAVREYTQHRRQQI